MNRLFIVILLGICGIIVSFEEAKDEMGVEDLIGIWHNEDGAKVILKNDGSCQILNFDFRKITAVECYQKRVAFEGIWNYKGYFYNQLSGADQLSLELKDCGSNIKLKLFFSIKKINKLWHPDALCCISVHATQGQEKDYEFRKEKI